MLVPRWLFGAGDAGAAAIIFLVAMPVLVALLLSVRFAPHVLGPDDTQRAIHGSVVYAVATGWLHGMRTVVARPTVAATLSGLAAHRMVFGINTLLVLVMVRHRRRRIVGGIGQRGAVRRPPPGSGRSWPTVLPRPRCAGGAATPPPTARWLLAAAIQLAAAGLQLPVMVVCGFLLGAAGQVVKLCADTAMQIDVDDALRGHVFAVQDSLFWVAFIVAITVGGDVIPVDGQLPRPGGRRVGGLPVRAGSPTRASAAAQPPG